MESANEADERSRRIRVGETAGGSDVWLPVERVLTGRAFVTGKSGSGKSNTASVIVEELLEGGYAVLIVDTDGEYYGLKEEYELLHAGADEECDVQVSAEHAEKLAELALNQNVPVILDVSGFLDENEANELLRETARHLFAKEKKLKRPFLLVVEECHEYIPEGGGMDETGKMLIKVGKRGRKHGLGILGISQRPADVKKDFITQANWLVWHRLTWENDTKVVRRIVGSDYGDAVSDLNAGEAFAQFDWTDRDVQRIQFKRKSTFDAGATPGLDDFERPDLKSVSEGLMDDLSNITEQKRREEDRIEELEEHLKRKEARIEELQREVDRAKDVSTAAEQMAEAVSDGLPAGYQARLGAKNEEIDRLHSRVAELETRIEDLALAVSEGETVDATLEEYEDANGSEAHAASPDLFEDFVSIETYLGDDAADPSIAAGADASGGDETPGDERIAGDWPDPTTPDPAVESGSSGSAAESDEATTGATDEEIVQALIECGDPGRFDDAGTNDGSDGGSDDGIGASTHDAGPGHRSSGLQPPSSVTEAARTTDPGSGSDEDASRIADLLREDAVAMKLRAAIRHAECNETHARTIVAKLASDAPVGLEAVADATEAGPESSYSLLSALRARDLVVRDDQHRYALDTDSMEQFVENADDRVHLGELRKQWDVE